MIHIKPGATYEGHVRHDEELKSKRTLEQRARALKRKGRGWEDIYVSFRHLGMTEAYAKDIVLGKRK